MAATTQSVTYAAQVAAATNYASVTLDRTTVDAPVKIAAIDLDLTADDAANTVINIFQLPPGAVVLPTLSSIVVDDAAGASALTVDVGDIVDPDRYCDGASALALGKVEFCHGTTVPDAVINPLKVNATGVAATDTSIVTLKIATSTTPAAGHFTVFLAYTCL
jgi:hypothetical protein